MFRVIFPCLGLLLWWAVNPAPAQTTPRGIVSESLVEKKPSATKTTPAPATSKSESLAYEFVAERTGVAHRLADEDEVEIESVESAATTKSRGTASAGPSHGVGRSDSDTHVVRYPGSHPTSKPERYPGDGSAGSGSRAERYPGDGLGSGYKIERYPGDGLGGYGWSGYPAYRGGYGGFGYGYRPYSGAYFAAGARVGFYRTQVRYLPRPYASAASSRAVYRGQAGTIRVVRVRR